MSVTALADLDLLDKEALKALLKLMIEKLREFNLALGHGDVESKLRSLVLLCYKERLTKRTTGELPEQNPGDDDAETGNGPGVMRLCAYWTSRVGGSAVASQVRISASGPSELRGKNGSVLPPGTDRHLCTGWHEGEIAPTSSFIMS